MVDAPERSVSKPRKALSFLLPSARAWYGSDARQKKSRQVGRNSSFGYFSMSPKESQVDETITSNTTITMDKISLSSQSSIDEHSPTQQHRMTFRVVNPDPPSSSSSEDEDDEEVIHYQEHVDDEPEDLPSNDVSTSGRGNHEPAPASSSASPPPPPPAHALSTPPSTGSSRSSSDNAAATPAGGHWYAKGWKIASTKEGVARQNSAKNRQSKVMEDEMTEQIIPRVPTIKTSVVLAGNDSGMISPASFVDRSRTSLDTYRQPSSSEDSPFPSPGGRAESTKVEERHFVPHRQILTRPRPPPPAIPATGRSPSMAYGYQPFPPPRHIGMSPTYAQGKFIQASGKSKPKAHVSKYAKASYSLTNHPDAIKIYRSMAEKTGDPMIQLSYAKYLLEIAELYDGGRDVPMPLHSRRLPSDGLSSNASVASLSSSGSDVPRPMSMDGYLSTTSRSSMDSVRSAPVASLSAANRSTATHRLNDSERRKKKMLEDEGVRWIKRLSKQDVGEAAYLQATWMDNGKHGFSKNSTKAFKLYKVAAGDGIPEAMYAVALAYEKTGDMRQAFLNYRGAADKGVVGAVYRMAKVHLHGEFGQRQNMSLGLEFLAQAAENANEACPEPPYSFGLILTNKYPKADIPVEVLHRYGGELAALRYFECSAQLGYSHAQSRIAFIYEYGLYGAPMHLAKSFGYYDLAAREHSHPQAMLGLSRLYNRGCRGPNDILTEEDRLARDVSGWLQATVRNEDAAFSWCQKAADQGLDEAMFLLGWYYEAGIGVLRDYAYAQDYYRRAAAKGHVGAVERLQKTNSMTRQQHEGTKRDIRPQSSNCVIM